MLLRPLFKITSWLNLLVAIMALIAKESVAVIVGFILIAALFDTIADYERPEE